MNGCACSVLETEKLATFSKTGKIHIGELEIAFHIDAAPFDWLPLVRDRATKRVQCWGPFADGKLCALVIY